MSLVSSPYDLRSYPQTKESSSWVNQLSNPSFNSISLSLYIYPFLSSSVSSQQIHTHKVSCDPARFQSVFFIFFILTCSNNWSLRYVYVENIEEVWYCCWPSVFFFLAFGLTTSGSLLFSSTMINSGGFVCLNYRVIHIHSFSLLLLHGLFLLGLGLVHSYSWKIWSRLSVYIGRCGSIKIHKL
jgi:hypothetical protein